MNPSLPCDVRVVFRDTGKCKPNRRRERQDDSRALLRRLAAAEDRMGHAVAGGLCRASWRCRPPLRARPAPARRTAPAFRRAARCSQAIRRMRPSAADEDHIQRHVGVLHPEAGGLLAMEVEQHALPLRQLPPEHEAFRLLLGRRSHFRPRRHGRRSCWRFRAAAVRPPRPSPTRPGSGPEERETTARTASRKRRMDKASMMEGPIIAESRSPLSRPPTVNLRGRDAVDGNAGCSCVSARRDRAARLRDAPSAAINPFGPGPKRTRTYCPGPQLRQAENGRQCLHMHENIRGAVAPRVRKPNPRSRLNHFTCARSSPLVAVTVTWVARRRHLRRVHRRRFVHGRERGTPAGPAPVAAPRPPRAPLHRSTWKPSRRRHVTCRRMSGHPVIGNDETVALGDIEPFDDAGELDRRSRVSSPSSPPDAAVDFQTAARPLRLQFRPTS